MRVRYCAHNFPRRARLRELDAEFVFQRSHYTLEVQDESRPPAPDFADCALFAADVAGLPADDFFNSFSAMAFVRD